MKIATWNINSVRLRIDLVSEFLGEAAPDVICLQETKSPVDHLPREAFEALGYQHIDARGYKGYNGVMIAAKLPFEGFGFDMVKRQDARHIGARFENGLVIHNFYVPAGGDLPDREINEKFGHKLDFLAEMAARFAGNKPQRAILVGDLNIAPLEDDVWSHKQLLKVVSHTPIEVETLGRVMAAGDWVDAVRSNIPEGKLYSWWSYRGKDWENSDRGRRLDHIWASPDIAAKVGEITHYKAYRGKERPSDHVPISARITFG